MEARLEKIINSIKSGTQERKFLWETTERKTEYRLRLKSGIINVDRWAGEDEQTGEPIYMADISFHNELGERVESIVYSKYPTLEDYNKLAELHEVVRRSVFKVDETLDRIFLEVESKKA